VQGCHRTILKSLCQRRLSSCGACCGLYNAVDHSAPALRRSLDRRTDALAGRPRTPEAFRAAAARLAAAEPEPVFPSVRVCPLLGWVDPQRTRVGCLAHPVVTGGVDLRDCGAYDAFTCGSFLCPSHAWLTEEEAEIVDRACADALLYGLVVTDVDFVRAVLTAVAALAGARVELRHLALPGFREALRGVLSLKEELEPGSEGLFGAFRPDAQGEPVPRRIDYPAVGRASSPYDAILTCVGADPRSGNDLDRLEAEVRQRLAACAAAHPVALAGGAVGGARAHHLGEEVVLAAVERGVEAGDGVGEAVPQLSQAGLLPLGESPERSLVEDVGVEQLGELLPRGEQPLPGLAHGVAERLHLREEDALLLRGGLEAAQEAAGHEAAPAPPPGAAEERDPQEPQDREGDERGEDADEDAVHGRSLLNGFAGEMEPRPERRAAGS